MKNTNTNHKDNIALLLVAVFMTCFVFAGVAKNHWMERNGYVSLMNVEYLYVHDEDGFLVDIVPVPKKK
ncbi:hypothetical protein N0614_09605 [Pseudomonas aeruginosa]|nr:hypothetical protein [Pseudomonas aeruginosa]